MRVFRFFGLMGLGLMVLAKKELLFLMVVPPFTKQKQSCCVFTLLFEPCVFPCFVKSYFVSTSFIFWFKSAWAKQSVSAKVSTQARCRLLLPRFYPVSSFIMFYPSFALVKLLLQALDGSWYWILMVQ